MSSQRSERRRFAPRVCHRAVLPIVLTAAVMGIAAPSEAAVVSGRFTYRKVMDGAGTTTLRPISFAAVEVWYRGSGVFDVWSMVDDTLVTDANGFLVSRANDGRCNGTYALRVFASNYAAVVLTNSATNKAPFYERPGLPGPEITRTAFSCSSRLDFSFEFSDPFITQHFNIADTARLGFDYSAARRDPREGDPLPRATVDPDSRLTASFYNHVLDHVMIRGDGVTSDFLILHEYAHFLQAKLSTFAPIPSVHDGCSATDLLGNLINSGEHAWMEGFANYFAQAVNRTLPVGRLNTSSGGLSSVGRLETPPGCVAVGQSAGGVVITPAMIESFVGGILWDLEDAGGDTGAVGEGFDVFGRQGKRIFQIFDRELGRIGRWPTIGDFYCGWMNRGLPRFGLDTLFAARRIPLPRCGGGVRADAVVFRPDSGEWFNRTTGQAVGSWGMTGDIPVPGFYDDDAVVDLAIFRPSTGVWWINNQFGSFSAYLWGQPEDIPVPGDYDSDGRTDIAIWRPATGDWWVYSIATGAWRTQQWGQRGDIPVPADYDLDGRTDFAIFRPAGGMWWVLSSSTGLITSHQWGAPGDMPVPGNYDGDGRVDFAVWRPSTGHWWVFSTSAGAQHPVQWGTFGDIPVQGDYDHDHLTDFAVWRPSFGEWFIVHSSTRSRIGFQWGMWGDVPIHPGPRYQ